MRDVRSLQEGVIETPASPLLLTIFPAPRGEQIGFTMFLLPQHRSIIVGLRDHGLNASKPGAKVNTASLKVVDPRHLP